jgi:hypothetical protein
MFRFGWLTISAQDIAIWDQFPHALFALVQTAATSATDAGEEFHLGAFEIREDPPLRER